ncbi:MAG TPA: methyltransferase [Chloroflexi bacterium]|jgi:SAM-dependent methyltransferase|nr:methyltransferase [Chloroflexota bacterium]
MTDSPVRCRSCGSSNLELILSLGRTPLANALVSPDHLDDPEPTFPLDLAFCPQCTLVQITHSVPPEELFSEYVYFSSFSDTMLRHSRGLVGRLIDQERLDASSLALEVASNDGYLLQYYRDRGIPVLGIEPAVNIARVAEERGIPTVCDFFGHELARRLRDEGRRADVVHANNVLAHVPDLNGFAQGLGIVLKDDGVAVIEVPYVRNLIDQVEFDTIYHEHLCYFSLTALTALFGRHGLQIVDVEHITLHGGSLQVFVRKVAAGGSGTAGRDAVAAVLAAEDEWGVRSLVPYRRFTHTVEALRTRLLSLLHDLKKRGCRIAAYGASAKGSTLLNYCGIGVETIDFVVDRSTVKQGLYTPGTRLRIEPPEVLLERQPDYALLLTWNFADEILDQQREYLRRGGHFIIPIPELRVV